MQNRFQLLENNSDIEIYENVSLQKYTTIKLEVIGSIAIVKSITALKQLLVEIQKKQLKYHLIGWGANQIIHNTQSTLFIKLDFPFDRNYFSEVKTKYVLPASIPLNLLTSHAQKFGLKGWEVFTGIPATLGGAIFMNAGTALGEIGNLVESVLILRSGELKRIQINSKSFSYRKNNFLQDNDVIVEATLVHQGLDEKIKKKINDYLDYRKKTQPLNTKNCGCVFKNFDSEHKAGQFIDLVGLKGFELNGIGISLVHGNFIENSQNGSTHDFLDLIDSIQYELELFTGIKFELEAKIY